MIARVRGRGNLTSVPIMETASQLNCDQLAPNQYQVGYGLLGKFATMEDYVVPSFQQRRKAGEVFFNDLTYVEREYNGSGGEYVVETVGLSCTSKGWKGRYESSGPVSALLVPTETFRGLTGPKVDYAISDSDITLAIAEACTGMANKRGRGDSNLYETLAEMDQTIGMMKNPIDRGHGWLNAITKSMKKGNVARRIGNDAANAWLAYRYGIRPIISDIDNLLKALRKTAIQLRTTTRDTVRLSANKDNSGLSTLGVLRCPWTSSTTDQVKIRAMSLDEVDAFFQRLEDFGLGGKGLITLPWELVTLSFVVDWFVNVGDFLGAIAPAIGWKQLGSCYTIQRDVVTTYSTGSSYSWWPQYTCSSSNGGVVVVSETTKRRRPVVSPRLVVKSDFRFTNATRMADAIALFTSRMVNVLASRRKGATI